MVIEKSGAFLSKLQITRTGAPPPLGGRT